MRRPARSLEDCLKADAGLARLSHHAWRLTRLQRIFESATPLARQSRVANVKLGKIVIYAANNAVAAKLRQMETRLSIAFRSEAPEVTGIEFKVQPGTMNPASSRQIIAGTIGDRQKRGLTSLAEGLPTDSSLRQAIKRLVDKS